MNASPGVPGEQAPKEWNPQAAQLRGVVIGFEHGGVQFVGRAQFALNDETISIPFDALFGIVGQILSLLDRNNPQHEMVATSLFAKYAPAIPLSITGREPR